MWEIMLVQFYQALQSSTRSYMKSFGDFVICYHIGKIIGDGVCFSEDMANLEIVCEEVGADSFEFFVMPQCPIHFAQDHVNQNLGVTFHEYVVVALVDAKL